MNALTLPRCLAFVLLFSVAPTFAQPADKRTRAYPDHKFEYTLPPGWEWTTLPPIDRNARVAARLPGQMELFISAAALGPNDSHTLDQKAIDSFEQSLLRTYKAGKRDGRNVTWNGTPAYQLLATGKDGTRAARLALANDRVYAIVVKSLGSGKTPVEERPEYEAAVNGFHLLVPPSSPTGAIVKAVESSPWLLIISIGAGLLVIVVMLVVIGLVLRRKPARRARPRRDRSNEAAGPQPDVL